MDLLSESYLSVMDLVHWDAFESSWKSSVAIYGPDDEDHEMWLKKNPEKASKWTLS